MWSVPPLLSIFCSSPSVFQAVKSATEMSPEIVSFCLGMGLESKLFGTRSQKDLGIVLDSCRKPPAQSTAAVKKKKEKILASMRKRSENDMVPLQTQTEQRDRPYTLGDAEFNRIILV